MIQRAGFVSGSPGGILRTLVILLTGDVTMHLFPADRKVVFGLGLCLGVIVQLAIPPLNNWRKQILVLMPLAILVGLAYAWTCH